MNLELVGRDLPTSDALRERIEQKLVKIEKRLGQELMARVTVGKAGLSYSCHIHFSGRGRNFNANAASEDLFKAADEAVAKIDRQVSRQQHKESSRKPNASIRQGDAIGA